MATEVDERVVEMRFDNDQFEAGIAKSTKSLEALDKTLEMNGSTDGMTALQKAVSKFDISGASDQVNGFAKSFSALDVVAMGALERIGMKITDFSTNILKKLTIEPVMSAFNSSWGKFERKTQSVQSILSATLWENEGAGLGIEDVNAELEKLMLFTDETSYNFVDMTGNIAKFTAQRIPLAESTVAMQGIATWAAAAGQSAGEASRAMYNISQAMGVGAMTLIDWKSIQNANMATVEFKELAIQAALAAGTLKETGEAGKYVTTGLNDGKSGLAVSVENFTDAMTQGRWLSKEVMMDTFNMYGNFAQQILQWSEAYDFTVTDMMQFAREFQNGTLDIGKAADELGMSAKEVATFMSDAFYIGSEAVQKYSDETGIAFEDIVDATQKYVHGTLNVEGASKSLGMSVDDLTKMLDDLSSGYDDVGYRAMKNAQEAKTFSEVIDATNDALSSAMMRTWETIFGNYEEARGMWTGLANLLYDELVEPVNSLNEALEKWKKFGGRDLLIDSVKQIWNVLNSIREPIQDAWDAIFPPKDAFDRGMALTKFTRKLRDTIKGLILDDQARESLTNGLKVLFNILKAGLTVVKGVWQITKPLINAVMSIIGIVWDLASALFSVLAPSEEITQSGLGSFFEMLVNWLSKGTQKIAEWAQGLRDWLAESEVFQTFFQKVKDGAEKALDAVFKLFGYDVEESGLSKAEWMFQSIQNAAVKVLDVLRNIWAWVSSTFGGGIKALWESIKSLFVDSEGNLENWASGFGEFAKAVGEIAWGVLKNGLASIKEFLSNIDWKNLTVTIRNLAATGGLAAVAKAVVDFMQSITGAVKGGVKPVHSFTDILNTIAKTAKNYSKNIKSKTLLNTSIAIGILVASVIGLASVPTDKLGMALIAIGLLGLIADRLINGARKSKSVGKASATLKSALVDGLGGIFDGVKSVLKGIGAGLSIGALLLAIGAVVSCFNKIVEITKNATPKQIKTAVAVMTVMIAEILAAAWALQKIGSVRFNALRVSTLLAGISGALIGISLAIAIIAKVASENPNGVTEAVKAMSIILAEMLGLMSILVLASKQKFGQSTAKVNKMFTALSATILAAALAISIIAKAASENPNGVTEAVKAMSIILAEMLGLMTILVLASKQKFGQSTAKVGEMFIALSVVLVAISGALSILANQPLDGIDSALKAISLILAEMFVVAAALILIQKNVRGNQLRKISELFLTMSISMLIMTKACQELASVGWGELGKAGAIIGAMALVIVALFEAIKLLKLDTTMASVSNSFLKFSAAALIFSVALGILASALAVLTGILVPFSEALLISAGTLGAAVAGILVAIVATLSAKSGVIVAAVVAILIHLADALLAAMNPIITDLCKQILTLLDILITYIGPIIEKILVVVEKILDALAKELPNIIDSVFNLVIELIRGIGESLIRRSGELMNAVAEVVSGAILAIGAIFVGIGKGIADVLTGKIFDEVDKIDYSQLNTVSDDLTEFAQKMEKIPDGAVDKAKIMADVAQVLAGITWEDNGGGANPLKKFSAALTDFGSAASTMLVGFKGFTVEEMIIAKHAAITFKELADFANILYAIPYRQGGYQFIIDFATQLAEIGPALTAFGQSISGFTSYEDDIASVSALGPGLANFMKAIIDSGAYDGAGESFKSMLETMGPAYAGFYDDIKDVNSYKVSTIADAGVKIVDMFKEMANTHLWYVPEKIVDWLDNLGQGMAAFSQADVKYTRIDGLIDATVKTVKALTVENLGISSESDIVSSEVLSGFATGLGALGYNLAAYYGWVKEIDNPAKLWTITHVIEGVIKGFVGVAELVDTDTAMERMPIVKFADGLVHVGKKLVAFETEIEGVDLARVSDAGKAIVDLVAAFGNGEMNLAQYSTDITALGDALVLYGNALSSFIASSGLLQNAAGSIDDAIAATLKIGKMMYLIGKEYHSDAFDSFVMAFLTLGIDSINSFINQWSNAQEDVDNAIDAFLNECLFQVTHSGNGDRAEEWAKAGRELVENLIAAYHNSTILDQAYQEACDAGVNILKGLYLGLKGGRTGYYYSAVMTRAKNIGKSVIDNINSGAGNSSPSKKTIQSGKYIDQGLIIGLESLAPKVESVSENIGSSSVNAVANSISAVSSAIESGIDLNPVITPILDMSNIQNGMSAMSNLDGSINVGANINSASFRASDMFGVMLDSAFDKLQKSIDRLAQDHDEVPDITININGATDPKAVAKEVEIILQKNIKGAGKVYGRA